MAGIIDPGRPRAMHPVVAGLCGPRESRQALVRSAASRRGRACWRAACPSAVTGGIFPSGRIDDEPGLAALFEVQCILPPVIRSVNRALERRDGTALNGLLDVQELVALHVGQLASGELIGSFERRPVFIDVREVAL